MSERKETFYITRDENQTRIRVTENDYKIIKAYAAHNERSISTELHYLISEASHCRTDKHLEMVMKLEDQVAQLIDLAQKYKKKYGLIS